MTPEDLVNWSAAILLSGLCIGGLIGLLILLYQYLKGH